MLRRSLIPIFWGLAAGCSCGDEGPEGEVVVGFDESCGATDGCDFDLSCLGAVALRAWTPTGGVREICLAGADLAGIERGCDLGALDVTLPIEANDGPVVVELLGFSGDDCAPVEDAPARVLFAGLSAPALVGEAVAITLSCSAGCAAGEDGCEDADGCTCCAGVCVDDDSMLNCGECFRPCDPYRADMCDDGDCLCGDGPACAAGEVCCAGSCSPAGTCEPTTCPFASSETCTNAATDAEDCGGGLDADACSSTRADACLAGGCTCGGGPVCADPGLCLDGRCVD